MTLLYEMQLLDELPMVWGASYFVYCQFRVRQLNQIKPIDNCSLLSILALAGNQEVIRIYLNFRHIIHTEMVDGELHLS